jgi:hypothetical protein
LSLQLSDGMLLTCSSSWTAYRCGTNTNTNGNIQHVYTHCLSCFFFCLASLNHSPTVARKPHGPWQMARFQLDPYQLIDFQDVSSWTLRSGGTERQERWRRA